MTNGACVPFVGDKPWYLPKGEGQGARQAGEKEESPKEKGRQQGRQ